MSSEGLHAPRERLRDETLAMHQAIASLIEELEAADWYGQRADDCDDPALKAILLHMPTERAEENPVPGGDEAGEGSGDLTGRGAGLSGRDVDCAERGECCRFDPFGLNGFRRRRFVNVDGGHVQAYLPSQARGAVWAMSSLIFSGRAWRGAASSL